MSEPVDWAGYPITAPIYRMRVLATDRMTNTVCISDEAQGTHGELQKIIDQHNYRVGEIDWLFKTPIVKVEVDLVGEAA